MMTGFLNNMIVSPGTALLSVAVWLGMIQSLSLLIWRRKQPEFVFWAASLFPAGLLIFIFNPLICRAPEWLMWSLMVIAALPGWWSFRKIGFDRPLLTGLVVFGLFGLGSALIPPYSWDEQTYQAALLRIFCDNGGAVVLPDNPYSAFPLLLRRTNGRIPM